MGEIVLFVKAHQDVEHIGQCAAQQQGCGGAEQGGEQAGEMGPVCDAQIEEKRGDADFDTGFPIQLHLTLSFCNVYEDFSRFGNCGG